jgi:RNA polymerase sigma factor (sigma-70 family)
VEKVDVEPRLTDLSTQWNLVFLAQAGQSEEAQRAAVQLMSRYAGAVHRYLLKALKDPHAAEELDQEFALRFLRGDFRHVDPSRGRFRDYVKRAVQNLMIDYYRRKRPVRRLDSDIIEPAVEDEGLARFEQQFTQSWRNDLLDRAWTAVKEMESRTGQPHHTVLRIRVDSPDLNSHGWAARLAEAVGHPVTPGAFRQALQRARRAFTGHLIHEVAASLETPSLGAMEEELAELELLEYCRPYLNENN